MEQVLFDFATIVEALKPYPEAPVIAFGGSYGGMLSAMFRLKYPTVVDGAISSSAPLLMRWVDTEAFYNLTSNYYENLSSSCASTMKKAFKYMQAIREREDLYEDLGLVFNSCTEFTTAEDIDDLLWWAMDGFEETVQYNYPYPTTMFTPDTPANPATALCQPLIEFAETGNQEIWPLFNATLTALKVYHGYHECYNITTYTDNGPEETWTY